MIKNLLVIIFFSIFFLIMIIRALELKLKGIDFWGSPPIHKPLYAIGKIFMFISWFSFYLKGFGLSFHNFTTPEIFSWIGIGFLIIGTLFIAIPFFALKNSLKMGIGEDRSKLITHGIYSISRNPMYVGFYLTCIGSVLYSLSLINVICSITTIIIHHLIVIAEEKHLENIFNKEWIIYKKRVRRYL